MPVSSRARRGVLVGSAAFILAACSLGVERDREPISGVQLGLEGALCDDGAAEALQDQLNGLPDDDGLGSVLRLTPNQTIKLCAPIILNKRVRLLGNSTKFVLAASAGSSRQGIIIQPGAKWSTLQDIAFRSEESQQVGTALVVRAHGIRLNNLFIIHTAVGIDASDANADLQAQRWENVTIRDTAVRVDLGPGAERGLMSGFELGGGHGLGIREHSGTGNTHVGHNIELGGGTSVDVSGSANQSTFIGIYNEDGDVPQTTGDLKTLAVGGHLGYKIPSGERIGIHSRLIFSETSGTTTVTVSVPDVASESAISLSHSGEAGSWRLRRWPALAKWGIEHSTSGIRALEWSEDASNVALNMSLAASECAEILACQP